VGSATTCSARLLRAPRQSRTAASLSAGCVAGVDNGGELFDGAGNYVWDPLGNAVLPYGRVYTLDRECAGTDHSGYAPRSYVRID